MATHTYAGFWLRLLAGLIDQLVLGAAIFGVSFATSIIYFAAYPTLSGDAAALQTVSIIGAIFGTAVAILYFLLLLTLKQQTVGMMALDITMTDEKGHAPSWLRVLGWYVAHILSAIILYIGFFMIGWTEKKQGLHDKICGTVFIVK